MIVYKYCLKVFVSFIKGFCKVVSISVLMCSLNASSMRLSAQVEVDDLKPFVQDSTYSSANYVRFFFKHKPGTEIGRMDINNLVRCERIVIKDTIQVPPTTELVIAYDFRDVANHQVGKFNWVCATADFPKGSVARAEENAIITAVRLKVVVGGDDQDASPVRFGIIGVKYGFSLPFYEFVDPSLAKPGTYLNDSELMRKAFASKWVVLEEASTDKDCDDWELVSDEGADCSQVSTSQDQSSASCAAVGINGYARSAMDINFRDNSVASQSGGNMYACVSKVGTVVLPDTAVHIAAEYIKLAHEKYGRFPTVAETRDLVALMQHYGLATSLTAYKLSEELRYSA